MSLRLSVKSLCQFSRQMGTMLQAGLPIRRSLEVMGRNARGNTRRLAHQLSADIDNGSTFYEAIERRGRTFPVLYKHMVRVGETSGGLEGVLNELAAYYDLIRSLWGKLITRLALPFFEYCALIFVLAVIKYVMLSFVSKSDNPEQAALMVLLKGFAVPVVIVLLYFAVTRALGGRRMMHEILVRVPVIGKIMRTLALARFCWCMNMMTDAGVQIFDSIRWSLEATGNGAYAACAPRIVEDLRQGVPLSQAMARYPTLIPAEMIEMINVGEESGSMPDLFKRLSRVYFEGFEIAMHLITVMVGWAVLLTVMGVIVYYILSFGMGYAKMISDVAGQQ